MSEKDMNEIETLLRATNKTVDEILDQMNVANELIRRIAHRCLSGYPTDVNSGTFDDCVEYISKYLETTP